VRWSWIRRASLEGTENICRDAFDTIRRALAVCESQAKRIETLEGDLRVQTIKARHIQEDIMRADTTYLKGAGILNDFGDENGVSK